METTTPLSLWLPSQPEWLLIATILITVATLAVVKKWLWGNGGRRRLPLPPGPWGLPVLGSILSLSRLPHRSLWKLSQKYGDVMMLRLGANPFVVLSSARSAREFLVNHDREFLDRPYLEVNKRVLWNRSLAFINAGERWREGRRVCTTHLFAPKRLLSLESVRITAVTNTLQRIRQSCTDNGGQTAVQVLEMLGDITTDIMAQLLFSKSSVALQIVGDRRMREVVHEVIAFIGNPLIGDLIPCLGWMDQKAKNKMDHIHQVLDSIFSQLVDERMHKIHAQKLNLDDGADEETTKDFLDVLISIHENDKVEGFDKDCIKSMIVDLIVGGTHTAAVYLEWAMSELLHNPAVMRKLQDEMNMVVGRGNMVLSSHISGLPYLQAVIKESFRLYPPGPLLAPRVSKEACEMDGYYLPPGTRLVLNVWAIGRDPNFWEDPEAFKPERFLVNHDDDAKEVVDVRGKHFQLLPFGAGRRGCPGVPLALTMVELILANLVHSFRWSLPDGEHPRDLDMTEKHGMTVFRKTPLVAVARPVVLE